MRRKIHKKARKVIGITGGLLSGKGYVTKIFHDLGFPYINADIEAKKCINSSLTAKEFLNKHFPSCIKDGHIDYSKLSDKMFRNSPLLKEWERLVHPLIEQHLDKRIASLLAYKSVVVEVPLLFEAGYESKFDYIICVTAPLKIRKERIAKRKNMTEVKFDAILRKQFDDNYRASKSHLVINNAYNRLAVIETIRKIVTNGFNKRSSHRYRNHWLRNKRRSPNHRNWVR